MKSIQPPPGVPHLCYCHSPARYIWEQTEDYSVGRGGRLRSAALRAVRGPFQRWDRRTAGRVTQFLANSRHTAARIKRCFNREAQVVYPPVRTGFFSMDDWIRREDWFLTVSALEPYKRTEIAVQAANQGRFSLKVVGDGSQRKTLQALAGPTVEMLGRVNDEQLRDLYRRARALIFPQVEDFGIVAVEAQACGCPVIAFDGGGARETVTPQTGVFMSTQTTDALLHALREFEARSFHDADCRQNVVRFDEMRFDAAILRIVGELIDGRLARAQ